MRAVLVTFLALIVFLVLLGGCAATKFNSIVAKEQEIEARWSEINNQYKRRFDLVPNLVSTVRGAADFEQSTITAVTEARASVGKLQLPSTLPEDPEQLRKFFEAQAQFKSALSRLLLVSENYPQLRASQNFLSLQDQLEGVENRIAVARRDYIDSIEKYNVSVRTFPGNVIAGMFGKEKKPQLEFEEEQIAETPAVDFDFDK